MMEEKKQLDIPSGQIFLAMLGFSCNNNCIMCTTKPKEENYKDRTTEEIIKDLEMGVKQNFKKVEFTGGEPTIRKDILELIKYAKNLGYQDIAISTNGRMLSYDDFAKKIIEHGVRRVNFSLYGHNAQLHDAVTRTPKTFEQTIRGIKNVFKYETSVPDLRVVVNTVVSSLNYKHLIEISKFTSSLGVKLFNILDLIPDGFAKDSYKTLAVKMNDLSRSLNNLERILNKFYLVTFFDFPLCLFSANLRENSYTTFVTAQERITTAKQVGYKPRRFKKEEGDVCLDIHKERIKLCENCKFYKECGGVWKDYLDLYGEKEIITLAKEHQCLS